jgi:RNA polymerase sigma factor (sigma-70 family)
VDAAQAETVAALRRGDPAAFESVYEHYRPRVYGFLVRLTGRRDLAEDLLQETWIRLARHARTLAEDTRIDSWLFTVARNLHISHRRRLTLDFHRIRELTRSPKSAAADDPAPFADVAGNELRARLERAIAQLPINYREVILLVAVECMEHDEAARVLGLKPDALRQRLSRARGMLKEALAEETRAERKRGA